MLGMASAAAAESSLDAPAAAPENSGALAASTVPLIAPIEGRYQWAIQLGLGVPQPLAIGAEASCREPRWYCNRDMRYFASGGYFRLPIGDSSRALSVSSFQLGFRKFISKNIYLGSGFGVRKIAVDANFAKITVDDVSLATSGDLSLWTLFFSPMVGAEFHIARRWTLGFDLGAQIALWGKGSMFLANSETGQNSDNSDMLRVSQGPALDRIAALPLPQVGLLRVSYEL